MLKISPEANKNYLAKVVRLKNLRKHENADRLQVANIDFQDVITGLTMKDDSLAVFFPLECEINKEFLAYTNSFRDPSLNENKEEKGFFEANGRVRAVKLRGQKSMGYLVPAEHLEAFTGESLYDHEGQEFDTIKNTLICKKYVIKTREPRLREGKKPRISRLVEGQVRLHVDTEQLRKNVFLIKPEDYISITYKTHGTSFWVSNLLVKRKLNLFDKVAKKLGLSVEDKEYDYVYGSRRVVKNEHETSEKAHYYDYDLWEDIKDELKGIIPKGFTLYGEALGYTRNGGFIQAGYDYSCEVGKRKLQIYRITFTNPDGVVHDFNGLAVAEFCRKFGLEYVYPFYFGKAKDLFPELDTENHWHEDFIKLLEKTYTEKDCFMCKNSVPEEGIVLRKESIFSYDSYKLKSFRFLEYETEMLDKGETDLESDN